MVCTMSERTFRTPRVSIGVGLKMAELRRAEGVTAESVAEHAREVGLKWTRSTVSFIETARRAVTVDEMMVLPLILSNAFDRNVTLRELLPDKAKVSRQITLTP